MRVSAGPNVAQRRPRALKRSPGGLISSLAVSLSRPRPTTSCNSRVAPVSDIHEMRGRLASRVRQRPSSGPLPPPRSRSGRPDRLWLWLLQALERLFQFLKLRLIALELINLAQMHALFLVEAGGGAGIEVAARPPPCSSHAVQAKAADRQYDEVGRGPTSDKSPLNTTLNCWPERYRRSPVTGFPSPQQFQAFPMVIAGGKWVVVVFAGCQWLQNAHMVHIRGGHLVWNRCGCPGIHDRHLVSVGDLVAHAAAPTLAGGGIAAAGLVGESPEGTPGGDDQGEAF
jgi:hypothetical protein